MASELIRDELAFLRRVERDVKEILYSLPDRPVDAEGQAQVLLSVLNGHIIDLLEEANHAERATNS